MAEFQWWLLIVGLVAGGGLVAVVSMEGRRRDEDISELEQRAEATWIAERLATRAGPLDHATVEGVLRAHREYLALQPPDRLVVEDDDWDPAALDGDADREPDEVRDDRGSGADEDLAPAAEEWAAARQQAHAGADREQGGDR
jgi:hypothetical protein